MCKIELKDPAEWKKHMSSLLHKENTKTHCLFKQFKEPSPERLKEDVVFKVPEPKKSPSLSSRKGSDMQINEVRLSPIVKGRKALFVSPVCMRN